MAEANSTESAAASKGGHSRLLMFIVVGIVLGTAVGGWLPEVGVKFTILGELFLNLLMMLVIPLVMLSMIVGITGLGDIRNLGTIGRRTVLYYFVTTGIAVLIGMIVVNIVNPGKGIARGEAHPDFAYSIGGENMRTVTLTGGAWDKTRYGEQYVIILLDQKIQGAVKPKSMTASAATVTLWEPFVAAKPTTETPETAPIGEPDGGGDIFHIQDEDGAAHPYQRVGDRLVSLEPTPAAGGVGVEIVLSVAGKIKGKEGRSVLSTLKEVVVGNKEAGKQGMIPRNIFTAMAEMEILPLIVFSLLLGAALSVLGERVKPTVDTIGTLNDAVMQLVHWIMVVAPVGIFGLVAARIGDAGGFGGFLPELQALGWYSLCVVLGLAIHGLVILPLILRVFGKRNPWRFARGMGAALLNAFSTASSSATLPLTIQGAREQNGISNRTSSFVLPLGATINMDGTALYESVAAIFIAQVYGIELTLPMQAVIFLTATLAAIGAAGIPEAGLVTMVIVLKAVGLPIEGIGLILAIDWLLDRFRTTVNVWGDSVGAGVIETLEEKSGG